jgi:putative modified peptide
VSKQLSERTVDALLDKLGGDDAFRTSFMANPKAATVSLNTDDPATDGLPEAPITRLARKEAFQKSRAVIRQRLLASRVPFEPINFHLPE